MSQKTINRHEHVLFVHTLPTRIVAMATTQPKKRKPRRKKPRDGEVVNCKHPVWEPLLGLARIYVDEFMWMFEIELETGARLQAYKHYWTRRYLYLDADGNAWFYREDRRYEQLVDDLICHFNRIVMWHYPGQHHEECEEWLARHEEQVAEEARSGKVAGCPTETAPPVGDF